MSFRVRLIEKIKQRKSIACVGLDPDIESSWFPGFLKSLKRPKLEFAKMIIDEVSGLVPVIKLNTRYFYSGEYEDLKAVVDYAHKHDLEVIGDCKENDIAETMAMAYKKHFSEHQFDAITVNAYFGRDGVIGTEKNPIFSTWFKNGKGLFVLIKTSNDSSSQIQNLIIQRTSGSKKDKSVKGPCELYQYIADLVENWGAEYDYSIGGVVGATYPEELKKIRRIMSGILLLPGFGVQGGDVDILNHVVQDQKFSIINSSRSVMYAYALRSEQFKEEDFAKASRKEVERMNAEINKYIPL